MISNFILYDSLCGSKLIFYFDINDIEKYHAIVKSKGVLLYYESIKGFLELECGTRDIKHVYKLNVPLRGFLTILTTF